MLAMTAALAAGPVISQAPAARPPTGAAASPVIYCAVGSRALRAAARVRPPSCYAFSLTGGQRQSARLVALSWRGWGQAAAAATGFLQDTHSGAPGRILVAAVAYRRRRDCRGRRAYTRLKVSSQYGISLATLPTCPGPL